MPQVWCQQWEESEAGWGVRPDGYSLHLTQEDAKAFSEVYMRRQQQYFKEQGVIGVPDEYSRPAGDPYLTEVSDEVYAELTTTKVKESQGRSYSGRSPTPIGGKFPGGTWKPM